MPRLPGASFCLTLWVGFARSLNCHSCPCCNRARKASYDFVSHFCHEAGQPICSMRWVKSGGIELTASMYSGRPNLSTRQRYALWSLSSESPGKLAATIACNL
jgi:hypothetical protein